MVSWQKPPTWSEQLKKVLGAEEKTFEWWPTCELQISLSSQSRNFPESVIFRKLAPQKELSIEQGLPIYALVVESLVLCHCPGFDSEHERLEAVLNMG